MNSTNNILDDDNFKENKYVFEDISTNKTPYQILSTIHFSIGITIFCIGLIWGYVIILAYLELGRLPDEGDSQFIVNKALGISRENLLHILTVSLLGTLVWGIFTIINLLAKIYKARWVVVIIGLIGIILNWILFIFTDIDWLID